jgi:phosphopantetheinyl transferase (holo-ACP synthase)
MILNTGVDIIEVERIKEVLEKFGERFQKADLYSN